MLARPTCGLPPTDTPPPEEKEDTEEFEREDIEDPGRAIMRSGFMSCLCRAATGVLHNHNTTPLEKAGDSESLLLS